MRSSALFSILFGASSVTALGINCGGSALCDLGGLGANLGNLIEVVEAVPDGSKFGPGVHIGCAGHLCAFTQNYDQDITAGTALARLHDLRDHGCSACGSDPINPGNDVSTGEVTANYVADAEYPGSGKCGDKQPQPKCPGSNCYGLNLCYLACCQGPTPITNPLSCSSLGEQCSCAESCGCCI